MTRQAFPTIKDVAAISGVSIQTVSIALRGKPGVSENRRKQIQLVADRMGYYPQMSGQILRTQKTGQIGIVLACEKSEVVFTSWMGRMLEVFIEICEQRERRYHIQFHHHNDDKTGSSAESGFSPPHVLAGGLVDGVVVVGDVGRQMVDWLARRNMPFVSINETSDYCVIADDVQGVNLALEHLIGLGHRRVALVSGPQRYRVQQLRRQAFFEGVVKWGLEIPDETFVPIQDVLGIDPVLDQMRALLDRPDRPTAVLGAERAVIHAAMERGLRIGRDISLIGWCDALKAKREFYPSLTAIDIDMSAMMCHAMELLDARLDGQQPDDPQRWGPSLLSKGESTGPTPG